MECLLKNALSRSRSRSRSLSHVDESWIVFVCSSARSFVAQIDLKHAICAGLLKAGGSGHSNEPPPQLSVRGRLESWWASRTSWLRVRSECKRATRARKAMLLLLLVVQLLLLLLLL